MPGGRTSFLLCKSRRKSGIESYFRSFLPPVRRLAAFSAKLSETRSKTYVIVSIWKCFIYMFCLVFFLTPKFVSFKTSLIPPRMPLHDLLQRDVFGEKLITITAENLNQTQINNFLQRMHEYETPGSLNIQRELYDSIQITKFLRALTARRRRRLPKHPGIRIMERT